jgi:hypothetical protein
VSFLQRKVVGSISAHFYIIAMVLRVNLKVFTMAR